MDDDPLIMALKTVMAARYNTKDYVYDLIHNDLDDINIGMRELKQNLQQVASSRRKTYLEINPSLCAHPIYLEKQKVPEKDRIAFTRFRVLSHSLAVEVGRWSRRGRGRLPLEERVRVCVETYKRKCTLSSIAHSLNICETFTIFQQLGISSITDLVTKLRVT